MSTFAPLKVISIIMKRLIILPLFFLLLPAYGLAEDFDRDACTSIMVGKKASTDGSVITSHTCDSWYRTWINIVPAQDYPRDTVLSIYEGTMHTEHITDRTGVKERGQIPQVRHTFRYFNTAYPCLNEHQLGIGETTYGGRDTLENKAGLFMIEELARVALERCTTAREAIRLMGQLIKEYGYGDSGECLTIADPNEVWIFEVQGEGPKKVGGVWAAQRIPDDEIAVGTARRSFRSGKPTAAATTSTNPRTIRYASCSSCSSWLPLRDSQTRWKSYPSVCVPIHW